MSKVKHPDIDKWAITYVMKPYPTNVGKIVDVYLDVNGNAKAYELKFGYGYEVWKSTKCKVFETKKEAEKEYSNFKNNKNNYALEG